MTLKSQISLALILILILFNVSFAFAQGSAAGAGTSGLTKEEAKKAGFLQLATDPSKCSTVNIEGVMTTPRNCLFLEEPIGGKKNWDLYYVECTEVKGATGKNAKGCSYNLWGGQALTAEQHGPIQALLTEDPNKPYQGPFGLLYSYVGLIYKYMSGIIVAMAVLFIVVGGIQITTSGGDEGKVDEGKKRITKAIIGLIVWFTASLILYTINPTFFAF